MIRVNFANGRALIEAPYNKQFVAMIHGIGDAKWTGSAWSVPEQAIDTARQYIQAAYGEIDVEPAEYVSVKITTTRRVDELRDSVVAFGKTLARAYGRDSGAKVGEDVELVSGEIYSGGSAKNWVTIIDENCVFILRNVASNKFKAEAETYDWLTAEVILNGSKRQKKVER